MRSNQRLGATIALLSGSIWWAAVAVIARASLDSADSPRAQLLWLGLGTAAIVAAAFFVYFALVFNPEDEGLELEPSPEPLPSEETEREKRGR